MKPSGLKDKLDLLDIKETYIQKSLNEAAKWYIEYLKTGCTRLVRVIMCMLYGRRKCYLSKHHRYGFSGKKKKTSLQIQEQCTILRQNNQHILISTELWGFARAASPD